MKSPLYLTFWVTLTLLYQSLTAQTSAPKPTITCISSLHFSQKETEHFVKLARAACKGHVDVPEGTASVLEIRKGIAVVKFPRKFPPTVRGPDNYATVMINIAEDQVLEVLGG